jgi:hypothetical protein
MTVFRIRKILVCILSVFTLDNPMPCPIIADLQLPLKAVKVDFM